MKKQELITALLAKIASARLTRDELTSVSARAQYMLAQRTSNRKPK